IAPVFWAAHQCAPALFIALRLLVALVGGRDLLLCAKHLFGAANTVLDGLQLPRWLGNHFKVPVKPGCSQARISADAITAALAPSAGHQPFFGLGVAGEALSEPGTQ